MILKSILSVLIHFVYAARPAAAFLIYALKAGSANIPIKSANHKVAARTIKVAATAFDIVSFTRPTSKNAIPPSVTNRPPGSMASAPIIVEKA